MIYLFAIILPPIAVLFCGKPLVALLNLLLTLLGWLPGVIHAFFVIHGHQEDKRNDKLIKAIKENGE